MISSLVFFPFLLVANYNLNWKLFEDWCNDNFGHNNISLRVTARKIEQDCDFYLFIYFKNEIDRSFFILNWSGYLTGIEISNV